MGGHQGGFGHGHHFSVSRLRETMGLHPRSLTASLPLKNGGKGRRSGFLLVFGNFSGAFAVKHREGTSTKVAAFEIDLFASEKLHRCIHGKSSSFHWIFARPNFFCGFISSW